MQVAGELGGLCGMAGVRQALTNTLLSPSQLALLNVEEARARIAEELGWQRGDEEEVTDANLLAAFRTCE